MAGSSGFDFTFDITVAIQTIFLTRMHSSRVRTVRNSSRLPDGVCSRGTPAPGGVPALGGVPAPGEVPAPGGRWYPRMH